MMTLIIMIPSWRKHRLGRENVGTLPSPYRRCYIDTKNGIRTDGELFMIGDSPLFIDSDGNITIKGTMFSGTEGLFEILTRKNVNMEFVNKDDLKMYKKY